MTIKDRLIRKHLKSMEETKKRLPKKYHPIEGVTQIHYGFANRKTITVEEIINYSKRQTK